MVSGNHLLYNFTWCLCTIIEYKTVSVYVLTLLSILSSAPAMLEKMMTACFSPHQTRASDTRKMETPSPSTRWSWLGSP